MEVAGDDIERERALTDLEHVLIDLKKARPDQRMDASHESGPDEVPIAKRGFVLSDAELNVAVLAAQRKTNREIGQQLWITVSTVEQHLTRVYRKLGISGRSELPPHLDARRMR
jgi:DNA-binding CsgD family transcriptional regulator